MDEYLKLLDWTGCRRADGKRGFTPEDVPPILERLALSAGTWCELVENFGRLFHNVAGCPALVDQVRSLRTQRRYRLSRRARQLLEAA